MADENSDDFLSQDPADKLRAPSNSPFSLPGDDEPPAAGLEVVLVQAEIDAHIFDLKTLEKSSQKKSIQKLVDLGSPAVEPLCVYLKHPDRWARMMAAEVLGKIHDPKAIPALKETMNDPHQGVRYMAELALKEISSSIPEEKGSAGKGKEGQGKPPLPAKVTAKLHPVEGRGKTPAGKAAAPEKPKPEEKAPPSTGSNLPEPKVPENFPEIKPLERKPIEPAAVAVAAVPPTPEPPPSSKPAPPLEVKASPQPVQQPAPQPVTPPPEVIAFPQPEQPPVSQPVNPPPPLPDGFRPFDTPEIAMVGIQSDASDMELPGQPGWTIEENTICPVCHRTIKADTRVCPHCHAKFDVSLRGFCPNCRKSVEIDPFDHHCPRCGEEVIDQRYESRLIAYGDLKPTGVPSQTSETPSSVPSEAFTPSAAAVEIAAEPEPVYEPGLEPTGEYPPIEDPALQAFADRYLGTETPTPAVAGAAAIPSLELAGAEVPDVPKQPVKDEQGEYGGEYLNLSSTEFPPSPEVPPLEAEPSGEEAPQELPEKSSDEGSSIRPMFATSAAVASSGHGNLEEQPAPPNVRRFAQEGGTPIYVPGQDDSVPEPQASAPQKPAPNTKQSSQGKKAQPQKPKPVRKKQEPPKAAVDDSQSLKKTEAVFTADDFYLYGNSLTPPEKTPPPRKGPGSDEGEGRGINPWLIAAPLFLIAAVGIYLLYFKATGKEAPYIPSILATEPLPTLTFTPVPTKVPTVVLPSWMDDFVTPILAAVENKKPDFFDNFSVPDTQWGFRDGNKPALGPVTLEKEALLMAILKDYGMARERKVNFDQFVETFDIEFAQNDQSIFEEVLAGSYGSWSLHMTNTGQNWEGTIKMQDPKTGEWSAVQSGTIPAKNDLKASLTVIRNGNRIAILVDGEPFIYYEDAALPRTMFHDYYFYRGASTGLVKMVLDNIRIWNLEKYQNLPK
jgi:HEAT repeats